MALVATAPGRDTAAFWYFDPEHHELRQAGPVFACGPHAYTDVDTENDPARDYQSASMRILRLPPT
jgi:hypothetical protein